MLGILEMDLIVLVSTFFISKSKIFHLFKFNYCLLLVFSFQTLTNVQATHVISMLPVLTMKVLLTVNVILGIMELDLIVLVSIFFIGVFM